MACQEHVFDPSPDRLWNAVAVRTDECHCRVLSPFARLSSPTPYQERTRPLWKGGIELRGEYMASVYAKLLENPTDLAASLA
jgi:hypothetical protein